MPLKKKLKTNKKQPRKQRTVATNKNTNTNKITVNVGSKTTSKRYTRNGSTQGPRQQYASAPYPVYNAYLYGPCNQSAHVANRYAGR